ncbi:helix-turn-helix transcriptional regulator [Marinobacter algicola]|uniref:DNA-binding HTH domain-containing protein n=1 Tax=Marinobacter algicola DG893 TaxID=443152 RepID=A6EYI2_9GAMM|nr:hypothetical protein [Marinobacter algicola]EDM48315.1 DNA-binding HTH domain-containing protein [Marinobacter algicola DG893]
MPLQQRERTSAADTFLANEADLIHCLYQSLQNQTGFHDFLAMLMVSVNGCAAQLSFVRRAPRAIEHIWYAGLSDEFIGWYLDNNMIAHDAVTNVAITQAPGTFHSALPLIEDGPPGDQYDRWESDHSMLDSAWLVVDASDTHIVMLTVQRTVAQGGYLPSELEAMDRLIPFIRQSVSLAETFHQNPHSEKALSTFIELVSDAAFVLNSRGRLMVSNQRGEAFLATDRTIMLRQQRFTFGDDVAQKTFFRTITRVARADLEGRTYEPETLVIPRPERAPLLMSLRPLEHSEFLTGGVLVTVIDAESRALPDEATIRQYFSLTGAEAQLCKDLITGMSLKDIAHRRHKSEATVRSYLKQVFLKTGQSRQGQLISTILSSLLR